jgi:hypothetical protein
MKESTMSGGRKAVYVPDHPKANNRGYVLKARYLMECHLGRLLLENEEVHHKNGNKQDDVLENLEVLDCSEHARLHANAHSSLDVQLLKELRSKKLGYKKIASLMMSHRTTIQSACKRLGI